MNICVFCASSEAINSTYFESSRKLIRLMKEEKWDLLFGGANVGLMREMGEIALELGLKVYGVIPERIQEKGLAFNNCTELVIVKTMHERKAFMSDMAHAFIALPGGFGTLEELSEVITHKQLQYHSKPIIIINTNGFYDNLLSFFENMYEQTFAKQDYRKLYFVANTPDEAINYIKSYEAPDGLDKWFIVPNNKSE